MEIVSTQKGGGGAKGCFAWSATPPLCQLQHLALSTGTPLHACSYLKSGTLQRIRRRVVPTMEAGDAPAQGATGDTFRIVWDSKLQPLYTRTATRNRSMELSELVRYRHLLLAMCDFTGEFHNCLCDTCSIPGLSRMRPAPHNQRQASCSRLCQVMTTSSSVLP